MRWRGSCGWPASVCWSALSTKRETVDTYVFGSRRLTTTAARIVPPTRARKIHRRPRKARRNCLIVIFESSWRGGARGCVAGGSEQAFAHVHHVVRLHGVG